MEYLAESQAQRYLNHLQNIMNNGVKIYPRGSEVKEVSDLQLLVNPKYPFMSFKERHYDLNYCKKEILWKLTADPYNKSIAEHAKIWKEIVNPDGTYNSNYGIFWFGPQQGLMNVVLELIRDPDSRRAVIPMLNASHMSPQTTDTVCTEAVGFRIRDDVLHMSVHMRSSDAIYGLGTDIVTFTFLYYLVKALIPQYLTPGPITITAMSSHIYSKHYSMVEKILDGGIEEYEYKTIPECGTSDEAMWLIAKRGKMDKIPPGYKLTEWLLS